MEIEYSTWATGPYSVLITGANRGIGLEFVKQFNKLPTPPAHVFAGCRSPETSQELDNIAEESSNVTILKIDLSDYSSIVESVRVVEDTLGPGVGLNLLINNAGVASRNSAETVKPGEMTDLFNVNAVGPLMVTQAYLPLLRKAAKTYSGCTKFGCDKSAVINMSSGAASITENNMGGGYAYRTSKAALNMITKNLSIDLKKDGILVSALHPGWVKTSMGGPRALMDTAESVTTLLRLMTSLQSEEHTGKFYHYSGREMSW